MAPFCVFDVSALVGTSKIDLTSRQQFCTSKMMASLIDLSLQAMINLTVQTFRGKGNGLRQVRSSAWRGDRSTWPKHETGRSVEVNDRIKLTNRGELKRYSFKNNL